VGREAPRHFTWDIGVEAGLPLLLQDNNGSASYIYGPGGMLLEEVQPSSGIPGGYISYYYHSDRIGSVRALTDDNGNVVNTYNYDAYGKTLTSTGSVSNLFDYTGSTTTLGPVRLSESQVEVYAT